MLVLALLCATPVLSVENPVDADAYLDAVLRQDEQKEDCNQMKALREEFSRKLGGGKVNSRFEIQSLGIEYSDELRMLECQQISTYDTTIVICRISVASMELTMTAKVKAIQRITARNLTLKSYGETSCQIEFHGSPYEIAQEVEVACKKVNLQTKAEVTDRIRRKLELDYESEHDLVKLVDKKLKQHLPGYLHELLRTRLKNAGHDILMPWG